LDATATNTYHRDFLAFEVGRFIGVRTVH
jgi:hypothetical protein